MPQQSQIQTIPAIAHSRVMDFISLTKPELTLLSVVTAVGAAFMAEGDGISYRLLLHTFLGTLLVGSGAGTINMYIERQYDALMKRTEHRPIPGGRISPAEALVFGVCLSLSGTAELLLFTSPLAAFLAVATLVTYLFLYTPLKRLTPFATIVGGIPGALPPLIGWAAVRGELGLGAWSLFAILFFWQMPHFLSLAWMYKHDYARGGYKLLTVLDRDGVVTSRQILVYTLALMPAALLPTYVGLTNVVYFSFAFLLTLVFLWFAIALMRSRSNAAAHRLFYYSLVYLPALIVLMAVTRL